ncbi:hypothetical protein QS257_17680 [Terrilactibacillus sp. S3-3]|nr:hypothetical protein QS257_17680 [Terrilactibacillus sp. S3-3]
MEQRQREIAAAIRTLDEDIRRVPADTDLKYAFDQRMKSENKRDQENRYREEIEEVLNQRKREEGLLKNKLNELTEADELAISADAYQKAEEAFGDYQDAFDDFKSSVADMRHKEQMLLVFKKGEGGKRRRV